MAIPTFAGQNLEHIRRVGLANVRGASASLLGVKFKVAPVPDYTGVNGGCRLEVPPIASKSASHIGYPGLRGSL